MPRSLAGGGEAHAFGRWPEANPLGRHCMRSWSVQVRGRVPWLPYLGAKARIGARARGIRTSSARPAKRLAQTLRLRALSGGSRGYNFTLATCRSSSSEAALVPITYALAISNRYVTPSRPDASQ
jgi:hypothetical protein